MYVRNAALIDYATEKNDKFIVFIRNICDYDSEAIDVLLSAGGDWDPINNPNVISNKSIIKAGETISCEFVLSELENSGYADGDSISLIIRSIDSTGSGKAITLEFFICKYNDSFSLSSIPDVGTLFDVTDLQTKFGTLQSTFESFKSDTEKALDNVTQDQSTKIIGNLVLIKNLTQAAYYNTAEVVTDEYNNIVLRFNNTAGFIGCSMPIGTYGDIKDKQFIMRAKNTQENQLNSFRFLVSTAASNWADFACYYDNYIDLKAGEEVQTSINMNDVPTTNLKGEVVSDDTNLYLIVQIPNHSGGVDQELTFFVYTANGTTVDKFLVTSFRELHISEVENATNAVEAQHALTADSANIALSSQFAKNAGYTLINSVYPMNTITGNGHGTTIEEVDGDIIVTIPEITIEKTGAEKEYWVYSLFSFDIAELIGTDTVFFIECENSNYSGNSNDSWVFKHVKLTAQVSWGPTSYATIISTLGDGDKTSVQFKLSDYNLPTDGSSVYLCLGFESSGTLNSDTNTYEYYPATTFKFNIYTVDPSSKVVATELIGFDKDNVYNKEEIENMFSDIVQGRYITCWGDSLTAGGGWTTRLAELTGMTVYNGGTGGENARTIVARQGADCMVCNDITIPADTSPVTIATRTDDTGISTEFGYKVSPLLQGGAHVNPCKIGGIEGTLKWTGSSYSDTTGVWTFTRSVAGEAVEIKRPTAIRTDFDMNKNAPYLAIIYIGQNGGYTDIADLVRMHRLMIEHSNAANTIILGLSSGTAATRKEYEDAMKEAFGRYFISLREYLSTPIYDDNGEIISCYGLDDQGLEAGETTYNGTTYVALDEIATGAVPHQILADSVHYTAGTKTVIGDLIYKRCCELGIF